MQGKSTRCVVANKAKLDSETSGMTVVDIMDERLIGLFYSQPGRFKKKNVDVSLYYYLELGLVEVFFFLFD